MQAPLPSVVGLTICKDVIVEPQSMNLSVIRSFTGCPFEMFPAQAEPFCVLATFIDGQGDARIELVVTRYDPDAESQEIRRLTGRLAFPDRLQYIQCLIRLESLIFPSEGYYLFSLFLEGEWMAHKGLRIYTRG
jgi:hypothetical protein